MAEDSPDGYLVKGGADSAAFINTIESVQDYVPGHTTRAPPVSTSGLEPGASWFRDKRDNHCATKADYSILYSSVLLCLVLFFLK